MKTPSTPWRLAGALLALGGAALAQVPPLGPTRPNDPAKQAQALANYRAGLGNAKALATANNLVAAEAALVPLNVAKPNTAAWRIETAQRLVHLADQLGREGQTRNVAALANSALQHLVQAELLATNVRSRVAAKSLAGFIHERYLANRAAALASYQAAAALSPTTALKAQEAATRLQKTDDTLAARRGGR